MTQCRTYTASNFEITSPVSTAPEPSSFLMILAAGIYESTAAVKRFLNPNWRRQAPTDSGLRYTTSYPDGR